MTQQLESELIPHTPKALPFDLTTTLANLSTSLTDIELGALSSLVAEQKRAPEGMFRHDGSLYVRYFTSHWIVKESALERFSGMPPYQGIERLEIPR